MYLSKPVQLTSGGGHRSGAARVGAAKPLRNTWLLDQRLGS
ncbi:MAG: hypothetical protein R3E42_16125 [Burkholderiaceae bacterium]